MDYNKRNAKDKKKQIRNPDGFMVQSFLSAIFKGMLSQRLLATACSVFMTGILPLAFRDGFFDINRFKVKLVVCVVPALVVLLAMGAFVQNHLKKEKPFAYECLPTDAALFIFLFACLVSAAMQRFSLETLWGNTGRYSGLIFLLCCVSAFFVIAHGLRDDGFVLLSALWSGIIVALLGILNSCGFDPLVFYTRMKPSQIPLFLSTIGNIDFFGAYLSLLCPIAAAKCVLEQSTRQMLFFAAASMCIVCGIVVSRSDSAFASLQLSLMMLAALCGNSLKQLFRINLIWAYSFAAVPLAACLLKHGRWSTTYTGALAMISHGSTAFPIMLFFLLCACGCLWAMHKGNEAPGRKRLLQICLVVLAILFGMLFLSIAYFTVIDPQTELGAAETILRFSDNWGTRRGFIYRSSIDAFSQFSMAQKIFGGGIDCTKQILASYMDDTYMLRYGVFNDAHCQPLQFLLTAGIAGASAYIAFWFLTVRACFCAAADDSLLCGITAALSGYAVTALLGVTQPIIITTYFSVAALGMQRIKHMRRGKSHES